MKPKGKLFALLAIFAAIGLVTATGAFTSVQATRTVTVDIAGDSAALLGIQSTSQYAYENTDGEFVIDFSSSNGGFPSAASGVNPNATTEVDSLFNVTNNGDQTIDVTFADDSPHLDFYNTSSGYPTSANVTGLGSGDVTTVGLRIDTSDMTESEDFTATLTINATAQ